VVWQIGRFDESSVEFTRRGAPAPKPGAGQAQYDLVYVIGKSKAETDWPGFQPGSSNGTAGYRPHPYAIQFDLPSTPRGLYTLKVALLVESPRVPRLEVAINGHRALYFQHPMLNYSGGDVASVFLPNYSANTITVELPTAFLRQGSNELTLTANDDPAERDDSTTPWNSIKTRTRSFHPLNSRCRLCPRSSIHRRKADWQSWWMSMFVTISLPREGRRY
jgi:hypothetical protein